jgi:hypothetical protein
MRREALALLLLGASLVPALVSAKDAPPRGKLQLYVMPDTQSWAWNQAGSTLEAWRSVAKALCRQRERFAMVLHTGDLVDQHRTRPVEWSNALSVMRELDACELPYAIAFGNHDFDTYPATKEHPLKGDAGWRQTVEKLAYRPAERGPSGRSALYPLADGWFVLTADFTPARPDREWLAGVIAKRRGARFVLLNHHCVKATGVAPGRAFEWCRQLLERNPEIRIAVSGHWLGTNRDGWSATPRPNGPPLVALYQNYQHIPELAAWGVVIELDLASGAACVWGENLLTGKVGRPAASSESFGRIAAGPSRRCFNPAEAAHPRAPLPAHPRP